MDTHTTDMTTNNIEASNLKDNNITECKPLDFELLGYEMALRQWLKKAKDFRTLKQKTTNELERLGFSDWGYRRLDVSSDPGLDKVVGTATKEQIDYYKKEAFYKHDIMFRYVEETKDHLYRSSMNAFLNSAPAKTEKIRRNYDIERMYREFGYQGHVAIPMYNSGCQNHAVFTLTAKNVTPDDFRKTVEKNSSKINVFLRCFEEVAMKCFPEFIIGPKNSFNKLKNKKAIKLLTVMSEFDLKIYQAAEKLCMSRDTADKQLAKLRKYLGVKTTHGALHKAIQQGLITPFNKDNQL